MVVLITDNKLFGGGNSCQHVQETAGGSWGFFSWKGDQIHHLMRITLALSRTDLSLLAPRLAHWCSPETVMPSTLWLFPHPWWLSMKYYRHFLLTKSSCQKLPDFSSSNSHSLLQKKSWCISTSCHLKSAFIDRHCPAILLTARTLPPRSTLRRVLHLSISSTPELRKTMRERWLEYLSSFSTGPHSDPSCMTHEQPLIIVERRNL